MIKSKLTLFSKIVFLITLILFVLNIVAHVNWLNSLSEKGVEFFDFGKEKNLPSIFSFLLLFAASILLFRIGFSKEIIYVKNSFWKFLGLLFLFLSFDELLRIHEKVGPALKDFIPSDGIFYYSWVIPYLAGLLVIFMFIAKSLFLLPYHTKKWFFISGAVFIFGAVGLEMTAGFFISKGLIDDTQVFVLYTLEELLEMIGVQLFIIELIRLNKKISLNINL